jgi:hypothetical protein
MQSWLANRDIPRQNRLLLEYEGFEAGIRLL